MVPLQFIIRLLQFLVEAPAHLKPAHVIMECLVAPTLRLLAALPLAPALALMGQPFKAVPPSFTINLQLYHVAVPVFLK
jgi:hypothetical protein